MLQTIAKQAPKQTIKVLAIAIMLAGVTACNDDDSETIITPVITYGEYGTETALTLARDYPGRYMGSSTELAAAQYMKQRMTFGGNGNGAILQPFTFVPSRGPFAEQSITSQNVVVTHEGTEDTGRTLYVGAHYDSSTQYPNYIDLEGLDDNASGSGVLSELVYHFRGVDTVDTIKFIAFGSEEGGLQGSKAFVDSLTQDEIDNAIGMINLDSLLTGDNMYANAGDNSYDDDGNEIAANVKLREAALRIADKLNIGLQVNPAIIPPDADEPYKPLGVGCCSDQESFDSIMPVVAFEATNWSLGPDFDGYTQTDNPDIPGGYSWHNPDVDNEAVLTEALGEERIKQRMSAFARIVTELIAEQVQAESIR
ncbi:M28 family peptidase [uncultured Psychrobacter sp.]|uniref:M28 family peptidase n=1 Tax=uncultured Psychrobacter sp. TaxID=259303 RepID=UPI0034589EA3